MVPLRPALIILGNALLRIKVGVDEMDKSNTAGDGAVWLFLDEGRRPRGATQLISETSLLPRWFRCGGPHHSRECFVTWSSGPGQMYVPNTAGDGAMGLLLDECRRPCGAHVQHFAPTRISLLETLTLLLVLKYLSVWLLAKGGVSRGSGRGHGVAISRRVVSGQQSLLQRVWLLYPGTLFCWCLVT
jgi:hypothetical protein